VFDEGESPAAAETIAAPAAHIAGRVQTGRVQTGRAGGGLIAG
jgi:hypothetical protein